MKLLSVGNDSQRQGSLVLIWRGLLNSFCTVKGLKVVDDNQSLGSSVMIWKGLLRIWNQSFCSNHLLIVKRVKVRHDNQKQRSSAKMWRCVPRIWHQRVLRQPLSYSETSQCCSQQLSPMIIGTDLKRSASNLEPTVSAATILLWWNIWMLSMTAKA